MLLELVVAVLCELGRAVLFIDVTLHHLVQLISTYLGQYVTPRGAG